MWSGEVQIVAERGRLNVDGEVHFGRGEGSIECGLVSYSLGEERGRLNVDW